MSSTLMRSLLAKIVDYAGLFPPASLEMPAAVEEYARQRQSEQAWMLGRFVVPVSRLDELERAAERFWGEEEGSPWGLSVLVPGDIAAARDRLESFDRVHGRAGHAIVEAIERQITTVDDVAPALEAFGDLEVYLEIPYQDDPTLLMAALARHGGRAKIRSGGITADAFPTPFELARFIVAASRAGVPFKATAGLHHPLRGHYRLTYEPESPTGTMHGFLNVFLASALAKSAELGPEDVEALLSERDPAKFQWTEETVRWHAHELSADALAGARRDFGISYGSCSFREPVEDLQALSLL